MVESFTGAVCDVGGVDIFHSINTYKRKPKHSCIASVVLDTAAITVTNGRPRTARQDRHVYRIQLV